MSVMNVTDDDINIDYEFNNNEVKMLMLLKTLIKLQMINKILIL